MTAEQRTDQIMSWKLYVTYFLTFFVATGCLALMNYFGLTQIVIKQKESSMLLITVIFTLGGVANTLRLRWRHILLLSLVFGVLECGFVLIFPVNF